MLKNINKIGRYLKTPPEPDSTGRTHNEVTPCTQFRLYQPLPFP